MRFLPLFLFLASCMGGPSAADVEADRARWTAIRDVTVDGAINLTTEAPLLAELLLAWDAKLTADEKAVGAQRSPRDVMVGLLRAYGAAAVTVFLGPELLRTAPALFASIDVDNDGVLSELELLAIRADDPAFAAVVLLTVAQLIRQHR